MAFRWPIQLVVSLSILLASSPSHAFIRLVVAQVFDDVVVTGSGSAITSDLTSSAGLTDFTNVLTDNQIYAGPAAFADGSVGLWSGVFGPVVFGSDSSVTEIPEPLKSSGQLFGILAGSGTGKPQLVLPVGYISGAILNGTSTFTSRSLSQLGLTPGQVTTWSWGSGATADSLRLEVLDPVPAPLPMLMTAAFFGGIPRIRRLSRRLHS